MSHNKLNQSWSTITRRSIIDSFQAGRRDPGRHPIGGRIPGKFPLTLTIGLMTIGVIAAISTLQFLAALFG
jgi:hypothetical protein